MTPEQFERLMGAANDVGGAAWETAVLGTVVYGWLDVVTGGALLLLAACLIRCMPGLYAGFGGVDFDAQPPWVLGLGAAGLGAALAILFGITSLYDGAQALLAPEWTAMLAIVGGVMS